MSVMTGRLATEWAKEEYRDAVLVFYDEWLATHPDSTFDEREALRKQAARVCKFLGHPVTLSHTPRKVTS